MRVDAHENDIHDIRTDLKTALGEFVKIKDRLNIQTAVLIGAGVAGGLISSEAGTILKGVLGIG